ncbi:MAG TPA: NAD(P)H-dependent oxidoreductase subunit E [Phycisphaerae bacterium]|nr:NAD(P)H-dependent oxidoreductase subunit E [Phycisphaerales bacterium]HRX84008.1 NAD(P)H-dependent oxidoreductase subunit E [Phycisphaerae bacterium]
MADNKRKIIREICQSCGDDPTRLMDIVRAVQMRLRCVDDEAMDLIAKAVNTHRVEVAGVVSFYAFLADQPLGDIVIRLCDDVIDEMAGSKYVAEALRSELGIDFGQTTPDGRFTLAWTPCIGMCDQAPAALVNDVPVTELNSDTARRMIHELREHMRPELLVTRVGDGNNAHPLVQSMVKNNLRHAGPVVFSPVNRGEAIRKALAMTPVEVIRAVKTARLRGCGGAGFPTGMKWEFTRAAAGERKFIIANADEGEPGTFKDRVILTERSDRLFAGMTIAGYAIGASEGILYLRAEYAYLRRYLEEVLAARRAENLLGRAICGRPGFNFDIRIQMGAGAYICGEETALINSCEGRRGEPRNRPPFPAQHGYLGGPTAVNNVETLCCVTKVLEVGPGTFSELGTGVSGSAGTKCLSISGDCRAPGIYEVPYGTTLRSVLDMAGGSEAAAVQVGGPSGKMIAPAEYDRRICFDDLATGGSVMVFSRRRDLLHVVSRFLDFFIEESCGYCTPCRVGNVLLKERVDRIRHRRGNTTDLDYLRELADTVKLTSRCGLGQTSPNPVLATLEKFPHAYTVLMPPNGNGALAPFDLEAATGDARAVVHRERQHSTAVEENRNG